MNMAKRAAAGAIIRCVSLDDEIEAPPTDQIPILLGNNRHASNRAIAQRRYPARIFAIGLSLLVALSFHSIRHLCPSAVGTFYIAAPGTGRWRMSCVTDKAAGLSPIVFRDHSVNREKIS